MKFFEITQNNSGGHFDVDDNLCHRLFIEAIDEKTALEKAENLGCYWNGVESGIDCSCCGDRWSNWIDEIDLEKYEKEGYEVSVYDHYENPEQKWYDLYGKFPILIEPEWQEIFGSFSGKIYFKTIEQYAQFLANNFGWTKPDIRIFFANGEIKEIFKEVL